MFLGVIGLEEVPWELRSFDPKTALPRPIVKGSKAPGAKSGRSRWEKKGPGAPKVPCFVVGFWFKPSNFSILLGVADVNIL